MTEATETNQTRKSSPLRRILLLLALITSPLLCCGCLFLENVLPDGLIPSLNFFAAEARIENRTGETLYLTPITTTRGQPEVILQSTSFRQTDLPVQPNRSIVLKYDSADLPLSGIAVCRAGNDCRFLAVDYSGVYPLDSFETLPALDPAWLQAIRSASPYNFIIVLFPVAGFLPIVLFLSWLSLGRLEKKRIDDRPHGEKQ
jgi:hypothetical protein